MRDEANKLVVVEQASSFEPGGRTGSVVIESTDRDFPSAIDKLSSLPARRLATDYAASKGVTDPHLDFNNGAPYAVNARGGMVLRADRSLPPNAPERQIVAYRATFRVQAKS